MSGSSSGANRAATRAILRVLWSGPMVGAVWVGLLAWRAGRAPLAPDARVLGRDADAISHFVRDHYAGDVSRVSLALGAFALAVGVLVGALASGVSMLRAHLRDRVPPPGVEGLVERAALVMALHAWLVLAGMARAPQLYASAWYAHGGLARTVQVLATDVLHPAGVALVGFAALAAYVVGGPARWHSLGIRLRARFFEVRARLAPLSSTVVAISAVSLVAFGACAPRSKSGSSDRPNVIVLAVDSLRADRLDARVAPNLVELASRGTRFDRAYVSLPRTFSSWVTILTGRHPHHHGVRSMFPRWEERTKDFDALPSRMAQAGYVTSVVSDFAGDIFRRIDLGFGHVDTPTFDFHELVRERAIEREEPLLPFLVSAAGRRVFPATRDLSEAPDADALASDAIAAIDRAGSRPFFVTAFFSNAHFPYAAPAPWYSRFTRASYRGRFKYDAPVGLASERIDDDDVAQVRGLYDGAVASVDAAIARVLSAIDRRGLRGRTVIVLTADHGETLYDHGHGHGHGDHLFGDEGTHVPLVIVDPRIPTAARTGSIVRDVDIAPTLYSLTGVAPPGDLDGRSLVPAMHGEPLAPAFAYAESELWLGEVAGLPDSLRLPYPSLAGLTEVDRAHGDEIVLRPEVADATLVARHRMIRDERWKLVYAPTREGTKYFLYDTDADPGETHDVAAAHPEEAARLESSLWKWMLEDRSMTRRDGLLVPRARKDGSR